MTTTVRTLPGRLPVLYLRSRALPATLATLAGVALLAAWAADWLQSLEAEQQVEDDQADDGPPS
ncbi:hypothetical protein I3W98_39320, partial [Streptomyces cavourensis]|nr:hypothetical protein [Streptomyces cavourensis]